MAEQNRNLNRQQFYHTSYEPFNEGDFAEPGHQPNFNGSSSQHVYFSSSLKAARGWADVLDEMPHDETQEPRIFKATPTGPYEPDPKGEFPGDSRTAHPLRIGREIKR